MLLDGRYDMIFLESSMACASFSATRWMLPDTLACAAAVANISSGASSPVAALMTCGPQIKRFEFSFVMMMKSVSAGL